MLLGVFITHCLTLARSTCCLSRLPPSARRPSEPSRTVCDWIQWPRFDMPPSHGTQEAERRNVSILLQSCANLILNAPI